MDPTASSSSRQSRESSNTYKDDIEIDPAVFVALEYQKNLDALNWTLESDDPNLRFKSFIDDLVKRGRKVQRKSSGSTSEDEEWETLAEQTLAIGDHEECEIDGFEEEGASSNGFEGTSNKRLRKNRETDEYEDKVNAAFSNSRLNQRIEWPEKLKNHPLLSKYPNPTIHEADILQTIIDIKERQDLKRQSIRHNDLDGSDYQKSKATKYPKDSRQAEIVKKRQRNTAAARRSRQKNKISEVDLRIESLQKFKLMHEKLIQISKMSLYINELRRLLGKPAIDHLTEEAIKKVADWNLKNS